MLGDFSALGKVLTACPICDTIHEVEQRSRQTKAIIKGVIVSYQEIYYACPLCDDKDENEFVPAELMDNNLMRARDAYHTKKGYI